MDSDEEDELFDRSRWGELLLSGTLEKRGMSMVQNWKIRHFDLYETRLVYYSKAGDKSPKGSFVLTPDATFGHSKIRPFCFYLKARPANSPPDSPHQKMYLRAEDTGDKGEWLAGIGMALRARKELQELAPRESLLSRDVSSTPSRFASAGAASTLASDISMYSSRPRSWRIQKGRELDSGPRLAIKVCGTVGVVQKAKGSALLPDPYCIVSVGSTVVQTQTQKQTLNAQWEESFEFDFSNNLRYASVEVWDSSSHAKPTFMGQTMVPLFNMTAGTMHRKAFNLGKRSYKSHVSGQIVLELFTDLKNHDLTMQMFKSIRSLPEFAMPMIGLPQEQAGDTKIDPEALGLMEENLGLPGAASSSLPAAKVMVDDGVQTSDDFSQPYPWEERMDDASGFPYYFNSVTSVSQWEKPDDFDEKTAKANPTAQRSRKDSQPPLSPHPSISKRPPEAYQAVEMAKPKTIAERAAEMKAKEDAKKREEAEAEKLRKKSKFIKLGSSLRMTLTWGGQATGHKSSFEATKEERERLNSASGGTTEVPEPFPSSMPPMETEKLEDMSWRVVLHSPPDVTNSIHTMGVLILTNYRLMFVPESLLLSSFDPKGHPKLDFELAVQVPIMMIAHAASVHGRNLLVKTKDSRELWFFFGEIHRSEVEEELLEMEKDARMSDASALHSGAGESMQPKKINQMNTGMKGLRLALKGEDTKSWRSAFMAKTGITQITHAITNKLGGMISTGLEEAKDTALKTFGLHLCANGRTDFENFLLGVKYEEKKQKKENFLVEQDQDVQEAKRLYTKTPWAEADLDICQGVLCDDGSALRRFHSRIKHRAVNAGFETSIALEMHSQLCESLRIASNELEEDDNEDERIEVRISSYDYVDQRETSLGDDATFSVPRSWIKDTCKCIEDGWNVYDIEAEYQRLGVPNSKWRLSKVNEKFNLCPTYPDLWAVPSTVNDKQLEKAAKHRSKCRMPVLTWRHSKTGATITRCSQPMVGLSGKRSAEDENLLTQINACSGAGARSDRPFVIVDARPKLNAQANQAAGKGFESAKAYANSELIFMNIGNIHTMRKSVDALSDACCNRSHDGSTWLKALDDTQWLYHCHKVMRASVHVAHLVSRRGISCLVHCSDGWDRTSQISSLAQLIMDPFYRTIWGFEILIEKDWLSFGFKFSDRQGFHKSGGHASHERSPVFIQFLDCVHQIMAQHPNAFQFNDTMLLTLAVHSHSGWFGNFLYNTVRERRINKVTSTTVSLWSYVNSNLPSFTNRAYMPVRGNIMVDASPKKMRVWESWFMRWHNMEYAVMWSQEASSKDAASKRGSVIARRGESMEELAEPKANDARTRKLSATEGLEELDKEEAEEDDLPSEPETWEGMDDEESEEEEGGLVLPPRPTSAKIDDGDDSD